MGFELSWWASSSSPPAPAPASFSPTTTTTVFGRGRGRGQHRTAGGVRLRVAGFGRRRRGSYGGTVWCVVSTYGSTIHRTGYIFRSLSSLNVHCTCCRCTLSLQVAGHVEGRMGCCVCKPREIPRRQKDRSVIPRYYTVVLDLFNGRST